MINFPPSRLSWILLVCFLLQLGLITHVLERDPGFMAEPDTESYERPAKSLVARGLYEQRPGVPEVERTPGYPVFLAAVFGTGAGRRAVVAAQVLLRLLGVLLLYHMVKKVCSVPVACGAAVLLAVDPSSIIYSGRILSETLFTALMILFVDLCWRMMRGERCGTGLSLAAGTTLAYSTLVRPISYYLAYVMLPFMVFYRSARGDRPRELLRLVAAFVLPSLVLVGGWHQRNRLVAGRATFSYFERDNMLFYRAVQLEARARGMDLHSAAKLVRQGMPASGGAGARASRSMQLINGRAGLLLQDCVRSTMLLYMPDIPTLRRFLGVSRGESGALADLRRLPPLEFLRRWLLTPSAPITLGICLYLLLVYGGCVLSLWHLWSLEASERHALFFLWALLGYFTGVIALLGWGTDRYRVPLMPLLAILAARGLCGGPRQNVAPKAAPSVPRCP
jgi:4-amino-4-deoxy-L-arabinose transferase-like glycosyltransferase